MKLTNDVYDFIKVYLVPILSGLSTFFATCGKYMNMPSELSGNIAGVLAGLATFFMFVINESSKKYFADKEIVDQPINNKDVDVNG